MAIFKRSSGNTEEREDNDTYDGKEKVGNDVEGGQREARNSSGDSEKEDPFGDESNSEVKYRTMAWWSVAPCPRPYALYPLPSTLSFSGDVQLMFDSRQAGMSRIP